MDDSTDTDDQEKLPAETQKQQPKELLRALTKLVEASTLEHEIKQEELAVRRQEIESNEKIAMASISAQRDFHSERFSKYNSHLVHRYWFVGVMTIVICIFAGMAIYLGAKDLVMDLSKLIASMSLGAFGGYHWGKNKGSGPDKSE
ncbi:hypothetical protein EHI8A_184020 [Entamoeba histolytica HM-1:IMSS-B]|uniref:DUF2335 domain-containing protein n=1 Tax=Entamoeba histolytica HM-1:IMSS-B TaxID=885319 RepID=M3U5X0_ENTH1|nr:hypothetical protein EHI8A_184020 [Entamoeba histolytica HM-1:IMSS-B]